MTSARGCGRRTLVFRRHVDGAAEAAQHAEMKVPTPVAPVPTGSSATRYPAEQYTDIALGIKRPYHKYAEARLPVPGPWAAPFIARSEAPARRASQAAQGRRSSRSDSGQPPSERHMSPSTARIVMAPPGAANAAAS